MLPVPDLKLLRADDVIRHPEHGFAVVDSVGPGGVSIRWTEDARTAWLGPTEIAPPWGLCAPTGFLARAARAPETLRDLAEADPIGTLRMLVDELGTPIGETGLRSWMINHAGMPRETWEGWWPQVRALLRATPGMGWDGAQIWAEAPREGDTWTAFQRQSPPARFRSVLSASPELREHLLGAAIEAEDTEAILLLIRGLDELPRQHQPALARLALDARPWLAAALLERRMPALERACVGLARSADSYLHIVIDELPEARRDDVLLNLLDRATGAAEVDEVAARTLLKTLPEEATRKLEDDAGARWPHATTWAQRQTDQPQPMTSTPTLQGSRLLALSLSGAQALARRHATGEYGGVQSARITDEDELLLGPPDASTPANDVFDLIRNLIEMAIGQLPTDRALDSDVLLHHLSQLVQGVPPEWLAVATRALAADPERRPSNGLDLWTQLARAEATALVRDLAPACPNARLEIGADTHIGRLKALRGQVNQDAMAWRTHDGQTLLIVADGISVSSAGSGDLASAILVRVVVALWEQRRATLDNQRAIDTFLVDALTNANRAICEGAMRLAGGKMGRHIPMGTTALVGHVRGDQLSLAALGDSRAYLVSECGAGPLTGDQNLRGEWLKSWQRGDPHPLFNEGHALVGYAGHFDDDWNPEPCSPAMLHLRLLPGELLVLSSDGLTDYATQSAYEMAELLEQAATAPALDPAARALVEAANAGGGGDNITVMLARLAHQVS